MHGCVGAWVWGWVLVVPVLTLTNRRHSSLWVGVRVLLLELLTFPHRRKKKRVRGHHCRGRAPTTTLWSGTIFSKIKSLTFYFPAQLAGGFALSDLLLDKPWSQVSPLFPPPRYVHSFSSCIGFIQRSHCSPIPIECRYHNSRSRAFR